MFVNRMTSHAKKQPMVRTYKSVRTIGFESKRNQYALLWHDHADSHFSAVFCHNLESPTARVKWHNLPWINSPDQLEDVAPIAMPTRVDFMALGKPNPTLWRRGINHQPDAKRF